MQHKKIVQFGIMVVCSFAISGCSKDVKNSDMVLAAKEQQKTSELESNVYENGYDLPIRDADKIKAEQECKKVMLSMHDIYKLANKGNSVNMVISNDEERKLIEKLAETGNPIVPISSDLNMQNQEEMERFLEDARKGEITNIVVFQLYSDGGIGRSEFSYDGKEMYVLYTHIIWNEEDISIINHMSYTRIKEWKYTQKGWFCYEVCVPKPPQVTEVMNGNVMIRVKPQKEEYRKICNQYLRPIGYQGNNLFVSEWDECNMKELDYNGLFEYLYQIKYQENFDLDFYEDGIPQQEFEEIMMEYLPVSVETLEKYAAFDGENGIYKWSSLGCGNYYPNAFGTSEPEITDIIENEDETSTITVDAVCEMLGNDEVFTHQIMVRFQEDGTIEYISNHIVGDGAERIPDYQYRFKLR